MELLRDRRAEFEEAGVEPIGISRDSAWTHVAWQQALDLNFGLVSDFNGEATRGFDVAFEFRGLKDVSERTVFLLDERAVVRGAWHYDTGEVPNVDELLAGARDLASRQRPLSENA